MATREYKIHLILFYFCKKKNTLFLPFPLAEKKFYQINTFLI